MGSFLSEGYTESCREKEDKNVERKGVEEEVENHSEKIRIGKWIEENWE
jgi:hypothetical protein